ncbi:HNH endonuclease [Gordonia phage VanLee]|uniref:HNH endonuclease n=1 Tax=Gordonia phage VanLee TaxID=2845816 RepID=A0A8F2D9S2_9CAUD|nr:HNH endonuclease [Gordonia phage VanLee]QWS68233.1 HNH endonuclease [Gordonia phage VanLee]
MNDEPQARAIVTERSQGICEACGRARATDWSHRIARSRGGLWCPTNGLHLCRADHAWIHAHQEKARALGAIVETHLNPAEVPVRTRHGRVLLHPDGSMTAAPMAVVLPADMLDSREHLAF